MAAIQRRHGPNVVGFFGLLQPFADGIKLLLKEVFLPTAINRIFYLFAPFLTFTISFLNWVFLPFSYGNVLTNFQNSLLYVFMFSSFNVYGIILAGWISNSRYSFIGALRSTAQMISYEVIISFIFLLFIAYGQTTNLIDLIMLQKHTVSFFLLFLPIFIIYFVCLLAESNRVPFDLAEAEAELVAGYNLEYSSLPFALFFLAEYSNIIFNSALIVVLFFGNSSISATIFHNYFNNNSYNILIIEWIYFLIKCSIIWLCLF
jgi:NADH:ubiquinone oxidoreductase subunit H